MRKGIKLLAAITAAAVVGTMSISAFGLSYQTSTNYDTATGVVSVQTDVTLGETEKNDEVAYLVYDVGQTPSSTTIKYIDQKNANGATSLSFPWTTTDASINAKAYVGSTTTPATAATETNDNVVKVAGYDVTYGVDGKGVVVLATEIDTAEIDGEDIGATGELNAAQAVFYVFPEAGYVFDDVVGDYMSYTINGNGDFVTVTFTANTEIEFKFIPDENSAHLEADTVNGEDAEAGKVIKFAKATGAVKEAGILVATTADAKDALAAYSTTAPESAADIIADGVVMLKAYQVGSEGIYAVSVEDAANIPAGAEVAAYAIAAADGSFIVVQ